MRLQYSDGGRAQAGARGQRDCVARAFAVASERPYEVICEMIRQLAEREHITKRKRRKSTPGSGVYPQTTQKLAAQLGFQWVPCMGIGTGCKVHLRTEELPPGRIVARCSKHVVAVIDGVIHDTHDPTRGGTRCVYGYWRQA